MARYVDAEKLEKDGWSASRTYQQDAKTMVYETAKMTDFPNADVVDGETYRELLKAAKKMHLWIFLNTADELKAYDECGLTDEMNALLGYGGRFTHALDVR